MATDEEQIKSAVENLRKFVKESVDKRKNPELSGVNTAKNEKEKNKRAILIR